jgi:hypothetical protein
LPAGEWVGDTPEREIEREIGCGELRRREGGAYGTGLDETRRALEDAALCRCGDWGKVVGGQGGGRAGLYRRRAAA